MWTRRSSGSSSSSRSSRDDDSPSWIGADRTTATQRRGAKMSRESTRLSPTLRGQFTKAATLEAQNPERPSAPDPPTTRGRHRERRTDERRQGLRYGPIPGRRAPMRLTSGLIKRHPRTSPRKYLRNPPKKRKKGERTGNAVGGRPGRATGGGRLRRKRVASEHALSSQATQPTRLMHDTACWRNRIHFLSPISTAATIPYEAAWTRGARRRRERKSRNS